MLLAGRIRVFHRAHHGRELLSKVLEAPALLGDMEVIGRLTYTANAATLDPSWIARIPADDYLAWLDSHPGATEAQLRHLAALSCTITRNERQALARVDQRVANLLLSFGDLYGQLHEGVLVIEKAPSQRQIAQALAVARRSVAQVFSSWRSSGLIRREGATLFVQDLPSLEALASNMRHNICYRIGADLPDSPPAVDRLELVIERGPAKMVGRRYPVSEDLVVGRCPPSTILLPDELVSPQHCRLFLAETGGRYWFEDLGSLNGTWLNARQIRRAVARDGDELRVGGTRLRLRFRHTLS